MKLIEMKNKLEQMLMEQPTLADMPCFILLGRDPNAPCLIRLWASLTSTLYRTIPAFLGRYDKCLKAYSLSREMEVWQQEHGTKIPD